MDEIHENQVSEVLPYQFEPVTVKANLPLMKTMK